MIDTPQQTTPLNLDLLVPAFVRRLLHIGESSPALQHRCAAGIEEVWTTDDIGLACERFAPGYFDGIMVTDSGAYQRRSHDWLASAALILNINGVMSIIFPTGNGFDAVRRWLDSALPAAGLMPYRFVQSPALRSAPDSFCAAVLVKSTYNPVSHAREIAAAGRPDASIQILDHIPLELIDDEKMLSGIAAEKQRYYLEWQKKCENDPPNSWFSKAQREFAQVTAITPGWELPYRTQAAYWLHMGDDRMAARVWRTYLQSKHPVFGATPPDICDTAPDNASSPDSCIAWCSDGARPRILILGHSASDYGMDTLYDGLCRVLGEQNVIEYPMKPMLHGRNVDAAQNYPCTFSYAAKPSDPEDISARLEAGWFDVILYADVVEMQRHEEIRRFLKAAGNLPLVIYDTWDDCYTPLKAILEYLDRPAVDLVFKREMLASVDYGANTVPLPFGYPESMLKEDAVTKDRTLDFFWAGKREFGLRPLILERVEKLLNRTFDQLYPKETYIRKLRHSRIGLSLCGYGFDTVRYWEIPAHGCLLLAERPPIRIPHNFSDGRNAVFFEDIEELEVKLTYYRQHPDESAAIAAAGHSHWKSYHTTEARARQLLAHIQRHCS